MARLSTLLLLAFLAAPLLAQPKGKVERVPVRGLSLEGALSGDSPVRDVAVYLPPSYQAEPNRRYPVVYFLHGFTDSPSKWMGFEEHWITLPDVIDKTLAGGGAKETIVVMPDAHTRFYGSMYSSSVTVGDWEAYVAKELVAYVDSHYRTLPRRASRGLAGHSMGGYGAMRIGMRNPDVFSSVYLLSACCMDPPSGSERLTRMAAAAEQVKTDEEIAAGGFFMKFLFAGAAAWSPNPQNPPFYVDLPTRNGEPSPEVAARWSANAILALVHQSVPNIKRLQALAFDAGDKDTGIAKASTELDGVLDAYGIDHFFEIYEGDHLNRIADRIEQHALPFFTKNLRFE
jgi:enterochelin esterase-like enzyme